MYIYVVRSAAAHTMATARAAVAPDRYKSKSSNVHCRATSTGCSYLRACAHDASVCFSERSGTAMARPAWGEAYAHEVQHWIVHADQNALGCRRRRRRPADHAPAGLGARTRRRRRRRRAVPLRLAPSLLAFTSANTEAYKGCGYAHSGRRPRRCAQRRQSTPLPPLADPQTPAAYRTAPGCYKSPRGRRRPNA
jgi:hypothetical protein